MKISRQSQSLEEILSRPSRAHLLAEEIHSSPNREEALNRILGTPGHRKGFPATLRMAVYRKLEQLDGSNPRTSIHKKKKPSSTTELKRPQKVSAPSLDGAEICSVQGMVSGGEIVPGKYYNVIGGGDPLYYVQLKSMEGHDSVIKYNFVDGQNRIDYDPGLVFKEVYLPDKIKPGEKIVFSPADVEANVNKYHKLVDGDLYEVRQPKAGFNFNGMFNEDGSTIYRSGEAELDFVIQKLSTKNGPIIVRAA